MKIFPLRTTLFMIWTLVVMMTSDFVASQAPSTDAADSSTCWKICGPWAIAYDGTTSRSIREDDTEGKGVGNGHEIDEGNLFDRRGERVVLKVRQSCPSGETPYNVDECTVCCD
jgi:hypothetical protein